MSCRSHERSSAAVYVLFPYPSQGVIPVARAGFRLLIGVVAKKVEDAQIATAIDAPWHVLPPDSNFPSEDSFLTPERPIEQARL